jgi:hypothetical protein
MPTKHSIVRHENVSTFIPAEKAPQPPATIPALHVPELPPTHLAGYARQDDDALSHARATLLVASAYIIAAGMITAGLLLVIWAFRALGDAVAIYFYFGIIFWGVCILVALYSNRRQGLHHSPTGVAHHELDSRERLARHAIDQQVRLLLERWKREQ